MPRHPRVYAQGLLYHLMARGNDGRTIFAKDSGYVAFLERLAAARQRYPLKSADARVFNLKNILRTCAGFLVGRHNSWAFPSPLQNSLPVASKNVPNALFYVYLTLSRSNRQALTKMAVIVPECSRTSVAGIVCGGPMLTIKGIYQELTGAVFSGSVMERDLPCRFIGRTKLKVRKFVIKLEEEHV